MLAALDADLTRVLTELKELFQRVTSLETRLNGYVITILVAFAILGFFGWQEMKRLIRKSVKKSSDEARAKMETEFTQFLSSKKKEMSDAGIELEIYTKRVAEASSEIRMLVENAKATGEDILMWDAGEDSLVLNESNYANHWITFKKAFPEVPQVFVGEANAGEWVFVKVDEKHRDKFLWAARSLSGQRISYTTRIQWFAAAKGGGMKPPSDKFKPGFSKLVETQEAKPGGNG